MTADKATRPPGRPRLSEDGWTEHNKRASFYLPVELVDELAQVSIESGVSKSEIVRDALRAYIKQQLASGRGDT
jgi:metal-responsive CopG/Arc/MetJ family transcriptional regulator